MWIFSGNLGFYPYDESSMLFCEQPKVLPDNSRYPLGENCIVLKGAQLWLRMLLCDSKMTDISILPAYVKLFYTRVYKIYKKNPCSESF